MNLCLDQLVLLLADRDRIASVSHLAADPTVSAVAGRVGRIPLNHGHAEEILPLAPDLVLAGRFGARQAAALLRRLGYRVVQIEDARSIDAIPALVRRVAALVGARERGESLLARFAARLEALRPGEDEKRPLAALYNPNGVTAGVGTVPNAVLELAGFESLARRQGLHGTAVMPLERLLVARPDVLVTGHMQTRAPSLATALLDHPALRRAFPEARTIAVPERYWICAGPAIAEAAEILAAARRDQRAR